MDQFDVVVPSAHDVELLRRTLPALASARTPAVRSVTLVDDRPDRPGVGEVVASAGMQRLVGLSRGPGPARNAGAAAGEAPILVFVDDDVELDLGALAKVPEYFEDPNVVGVLGGLRPPPGVPPWLCWAYEDGIVTPATSCLPDADVRLSSLATGLCAIRRDAFEEVGGFQDAPGIEDAVFGLGLAAARPGARLLRRSDFSGIHHYEPTWAQWLERSEATGRHLAAIVARLPEDQGRVLLENHRLDDSARGRIKRLAGWLPMGLGRRPVGRLWCKVAAAGAEARGHRRAGGS